MYTDYVLDMCAVGFTAGLTEEQTMEAVEKKISVEDFMRQHNVTEINERAKATLQFLQQAMVKR